MKFLTNAPPSSFRNRSWKAKGPFDILNLPATKTATEILPNIFVVRLMTEGGGAGSSSRGGGVF